MRVPTLATPTYRPSRSRHRHFDFSPVAFVASFTASAALSTPCLQLMGEKRDQNDEWDGHTEEQTAK
jgi:hypothetical protein